MDQRATDWTPHAHAADCLGGLFGSHFQRRATPPQADIYYTVLSGTHITGLLSDGESWIEGERDKGGDSVNTRRGGFP